jgi:DNA-binding NarL/FixJ family response regulator
MRLSAQQLRIVRLLCEGRRDKQIAAALTLSLPTVRTYFSRIFARVGVSDRMELLVRVFAVWADVCRCVTRHRTR